MAGFFQQFLKGAGDGFFGSPYLKDFKHASKTFTTNGYANAPKFKWLFHVYFDINKTNITSDLAGVFPESTNYGLLVKTIDLPKFNIPLTELNQYNRKRLVQTKISYEPVRISFHDDNASQVTHLWHTYYSYYYNDPSQPTKGQGGQSLSTSTRVDPGQAADRLNRRNLYDDDLSSEQDWGYQGEISSANALFRKTPFFKAIRIYGFNQHNFMLYELINPMIENFSHDSYEYAQTTATMQHSMTVKYENVKYYSGALNGEEPGSIVQGFGAPGVYDTELSPISRPGNNKNIMGPGGLLDAGNGILSDLSKGNVLGAIQTAGRAANTFKNPQAILQTAQTELIKGAIGAINNPASVRNVVNFPSAGATSGTNVTQINNSTSTPATTPARIPSSANNPMTGPDI